VIDNEANKALVAKIDAEVAADVKREENIVTTPSLAEQIATAVTAALASAKKTA
jgi:hypothetical protein